MRFVQGGLALEVPRRRLVELGTPRVRDGGDQVAENLVFLPAEHPLRCLAPGGHAPCRIQRDDGDGRRVDEGLQRPGPLPERTLGSLLRERLVDRRHQMIHLERLGHIAEGAAVDRLDGGGGRGLVRDDDDLGGRGGGLDGLEQDEPGDVRQVKVQNCRIDSAVRQQLERGPGLGRGLDGMTTMLQHITDACGSVHQKLGLSNDRAGVNAPLRS